MPDVKWCPKNVQAVPFLVQVQLRALFPVFAEAWAFRTVRRTSICYDDTSKYDTMMPGVGVIYSNDRTWWLRASTRAALLLMTAL